MDVTEKLRVWKEYTEELLNNNRGAHLMINAISGPPIIESEVTSALQRSKNGKANGPSLNLKEMTQLFNDTDNISIEWLLSTFITLLKKTTVNSCEEYRSTQFS